MKLGFLGYGNLAKALTAGLCRDGGALTPAQITVTAHTAATLALAASHGHGTAPDARTLFSECDTVVLAIKPRVFRELAGELAAYITPHHRIISVMCAVHIDEISAALGCPVMRVMPTLAAAEGCDILGYTPVEGADYSDVIALLGSLGDALEMNEHMLDRLTVAASCGLGFAAHILEAYKRECLRLGFDDAQSDAIVRRMFVFAAESGKNADEAGGEKNAAVSAGSDKSAAEAGSEKSAAVSAGSDKSAAVAGCEKNAAVSAGSDKSAAEAGCEKNAAPAADSFTRLETRVATRGGATEAGNLAMDADLRAALSAAFNAAGERAIPKE